MPQCQPYPTLSWVIGKERGSETIDADLEHNHSVFFFYKEHLVARSVVLTQSCPFPPWLCSLFQQSTSDVCQQAERAPHDAFPFPTNILGMRKVLAQYAL